MSETPEHPIELPPEPPPPGPYQHPDCTQPASACRVTMQHRTVAVAWEPVYDGSGAMVNSDPSTTVNEYTCTTCGRVWQITTAAGKRQFNDVTPP